MIHAPCLNCKDRVLGCHDTCERYISYRKELDKVNAEDRERRKEESLHERHFRHKRRS